MDPFRTLTAVAMPLVRDNVDTDAIIPSREMKSVSKKGLAEGLFAGWRYIQVGSRVPNPNFVMNQPCYAGARILLGGGNFGCGSSREHAVWALAEYGFRAIIAASFNPIFRANCVRNGIVPVDLPKTTVERIAREIAPDPLARPITVDLVDQLIVSPSGEQIAFALEGEVREMLLGGLDPIDLTLQRADEIAAFRNGDRLRRPWVYL